MEATFVNTNAAATLKLGQARGIAMLVPAKAGLSGCRVRAQRREKDRCRRRPRREDADPHDDRRAAAEGRSTKRGRRRRAGDRGLPRPSSRQARRELRRGGVMIGKLKGIIDSYGEDYIILDVGGVGYQVHCSARTLQALPAPGEAATLVDRNLRARGPDQAVRFCKRRRARMVPSAADRAGGRCQGRACRCSAR